METDVVSGQGGTTTADILNGLLRAGTTYLDYKYASDRPSGSLAQGQPTAPAPRPSTDTAGGGFLGAASWGGVMGAVVAALVLGLLTYFATKNAAWALMAGVVGAVVVAFMSAKKG